MSGWNFCCWGRKKSDNDLSEGPLLPSKVNNSKGCESQCATNIKNLNSFFADYTMPTVFVVSIAGGSSPYANLFESRAWQYFWNYVDAGGSLFATITEYYEK